MVEEVGQVSSDPEAAYDPDRIDDDTDAWRFNPVFLYVFGISNYVLKSGCVTSNSIGAPNTASNP
jgi:hypothetical protein